MTQTWIMQFFLSPRLKQHKESSSSGRRKPLAFVNTTLQFIPHPCLQELCSYGDGCIVLLRLVNDFTKKNKESFSREQKQKREKSATYPQNCRFFVWILWHVAYGLFRPRLIYKKVHTVPVTSNFRTHAWSIKCRWKKIINYTVQL